MNKFKELNELKKTIGVSPTKENSIKTLKYKGQYLHIIYLADEKSFIPLRGFRSYKSALDFGRKLMNEDTPLEDVFFKLIEEDESFKDID